MAGGTQLVWRTPLSQQMSARHLNNKMTRNPALPQGFQKPMESTEKACAHVANPCYRDKTLENVIASGHLRGHASGRASGRVSGRHVGPSIPSWPQGGKRVDQTEPQNSHQLTIQTDTDLWAESRSTRFGRYVDL